MLSGCLSLANTRSACGSGLPLLRRRLLVHLEPVLILNLSYLHLMAALGAWAHREAKLPPREKLEGLTPPWMGEQGAPETSPTRRMPAPLTES